jgi:protein-L-isoaspartate(D-aspartate) O-methyltransferase
MEEYESIIKLAGEKMRKMLESVYDYNGYFVHNEEQENLLNRILFAMSLVDRKYFVSEQEYSDVALPIGLGQTISQPSTVARMLLLAELKQGDEVLEIGTGSGWNASLISYLVFPGSVLSLERIYKLIEKAEGNLKDFRNFLKVKKPGDFQKFSKLEVRAEDIFSGKIKRSFDKIIFTAGIANHYQEDQIIELAKAFLKQGGILVCPVISGPILIYKKQGKLMRESTKEEYAFLPLKQGLEA